ncbi:L,D-transpeptidase family protein [Amycolatopsis sp. NPDC004378]
MIDGDGDRHAPADQDDPQQEGATGPITPSGARHRLEQPPAVTRRRRTVLWTLGALVVVALGVTGWAACGATPPVATSATIPATTAGSDTGDGPAIVDPQPVSPQQLGSLPAATTFGDVAAAPKDPAPGQVPGGRLVHPSTTVALYASPGGPAVAALPPTQLVSDTWLPVVAEQPGWAEVLLPSRPNDTAAWIYLDDTVTTAHSPYRIEVDRAHFALTLFKDGKDIGHWTVGIGKPNSPTPATRTFVLASIKDTHPTFSPIVLPTGAHSDTYESYGGGPGTVGLHTWPSPEVYGHPSSDGCIRIPPDALQVISNDVPIGSPVLIR